MKNEQESGRVLESEFEGAAQQQTEPASPGTGHPGHDIAVHPAPAETEPAEGSEEADESKRPIDYSTFSKKDFVALASELSRDNNYKRVETILREIKPLYDEIRDRERSKALEKFKGKDGVADGFEFRGDELDQSFDATLKLIRDRRNLFYKGLEEQKTENLRRKMELLEKLRVLVDAEDSEHTFHEFKILQHEWKSIGPVGITHGKTLWANYAALVDRFYDQRSIYFELKELDRKKNLEAKLEICDKTEKLLHVGRVKDAITELNNLHDEFKHIGPVPKEDKDAVWVRFKAASDAIYAKREAYVADLQTSLQKNLEEKLVLGEQLAQFAAFQSDRIKEWNAKTQEILDLQKKWEASGAVPRAKAKEINKKFWSSFKTFFNNKNGFFRKLDEERDKNLKQKTEIIRQALALQDSSDWDKTANELKELQRRWKETGPVPEKFREKLFAEFKQACDHFFDQRRGQFEKADREQEQNLSAKEAICAELEQLTAARTGTLQLLTALRTKFSAIGFVPKKSMSAIRIRFNEAVDRFLSSLQISEDEKDRALLEVQLGNLKDDPEADRKIHHKEQAIRKRITKAENDIAVLRNNLEFFGRSKNAEKFKAEFNAKIDEANGHLLQLKNQLKMLRAVSQ